MDTLVFDIETKNFFTDPGVGWNNFEALQISAVGVYSYLRDRYFCFDEYELVQAAELFAASSLLVGFSINRYDIPVLNIHFQRIGRDFGVDPIRDRLASGTATVASERPVSNGINLWVKDRLDILEEIEMAVGHRVSLDKLSRANLGIGKDRHSAEAITLYQNGEIEELKKYCLEDVRLTKELYDMYRRNRELLVPDKRTGEIIKVAFGHANVLALNKN